MSDPTHIEELRKEIESLCGNCDRPGKEQLGKIILSSMALGFSYGINADRPQGEWINDGLDGIGAMGVEYRWHKCSQCGFRISKSPSAYYPNFCETCGAKMKGADDEQVL